MGCGFSSGKFLCMCVCTCPFPMARPDLQSCKDCCSFSLIEQVLLKGNFTCVSSCNNITKPTEVPLKIMGRNWIHK